MPRSGGVDRSSGSGCSSGSRGRSLLHRALAIQRARRRNGTRSGLRSLPYSVQSSTANDVGACIRSQRRCLATVQLELFGGEVVGGERLPPTHCCVGLDAKPPVRVVNSARAVNGTAIAPGAKDARRAVISPAGRGLAAGVKIPWCRRPNGSRRQRRSRHCGSSSRALGSDDNVRVVGSAAFMITISEVKSGLPPR